MEKNIVTRTFSIGAISSGSKPPDDYFTERRHSSAGMRALLWAASSTASFRFSLASESQSSRESIFSNIVTPDSIPQFTIPSLSVEPGLRPLGSEQEKGDAGSREDLGSSGTEQEASGSVSRPRSTFSSSTSSSASALVLLDRRAERSASDPLTHRRSHPKKSYAEAQHCFDPASRAALSLPHLTKVTTPYGFVTLGQSPQMASEEALLCQAALRRLNKGEESARCLSKSPVTRSGHGKGRPTDAKKRLPTDSADTQSKGTLIKEIKAGASKDTVSPSSSASTVPRHADGKLKRRFYEVIVKHFMSRH